MKQLTSKNTGKHFFILLVALALLPFSSVLGNTSVPLSATVVPRDNLEFHGKGYLNVEDQRDYGDAILSIPVGETGSVKLEIFDNSQVSAEWIWEIESHTRFERAYRYYDYSKDEFQCIDMHGRLFRIVIRTYVHENLITRYILAYGEGAFFTGHTT